MKFNTPALKLALAVGLGALVLSGCAGTPSSSGNSTVAQAAQAATVVGGTEAVVASPAIQSSGVTAPTTASTTQRVATPTAQADWDPADTLSIASAGASTQADAEIALGDPATVTGSGAVADGGGVTITAAGTYSITGTLGDGQVVVDTGDEQAVTLILNGASITSSGSAPIYIKRAKKAVIVLADGTENHIRDGESYVIGDPEAGEPDAAIFSRGDLTVTGNGSLTVDANCNHGIASKDELKITAGNITISAVGDGIRGRDYIALKGGSVTVNAGGDGLQSNNDEDPERGFVTIEGGALNVSAGLDGIQAETRVLVTGGDLAITTGGGSANSSSASSTWGDWPQPGGAMPVPNTATKDNSEPSAKGIKALVGVTIEGGTVNIDSSDDSLHSNASMTIEGGNIALASGDDGMHADATLTVSGGVVEISKSYEGIESAVVTIVNGTIHVTSSDDGINVAGGMDGSAMGGRPGQNMFISNSSQYLKIDGGYLVVDAMGDGLDSNGSITMTGGTVIVNGPTANNNGALDHSGFKITGGTLVAVGSSGMAQSPDTSSTQNSLLVNLTAAQPAATLVHIETEAGEEVLTFAPTKSYQSVVVSSPALKTGTTYVVYTGDSSDGAVTDGVHSGGNYSPGTQAATLAISGVVTSAGAASRVGPGGGLRR